MFPPDGIDEPRPAKKVSIRPPSIASKPSVATVVMKKTSILSSKKPSIAMGAAGSGAGGEGINSGGAGEAGGHVGGGNAGAGSSSGILGKFKYICCLCAPKYI